MERQRVLNLGFVLEHEKLRRNTNAFWGPEMVPFVYTSSRWGVDSSCEGSPDSNIGSSYQPAPTTDSSVSGPCARFRKKKRVLSPVTRSPSPPLLPTCRQPVVPLRFLCLRDLASFTDSSVDTFRTIETLSMPFEACVSL